MRRSTMALVLLTLAAAPARAGVGDPQVETDHPWYPGERAFSTFDRLFEAEARAFERLVGRRPSSDEDRALASWLWRNTHYWHGQPGDLDLEGDGFDVGGDPKIREYWAGLYAFGFGLCGTTHAQWSGEMEALLGHGRARVVGVTGHNSFEVWLTGGPYGEGRWALLDHDVCTVVFDPEGRRLLSIAEVRTDLDRLIDPGFRPDRQRGWPLSGLHPADARAYGDYNTAEYLAGYAAAPPMVDLRRGERLRRYLRPGLDDGRTFVYWGRNDRVGDQPGPQRDRTWVGQPDRFLGSPEGAGSASGRARFANAVFAYTPDFRSGDYREGVADEGDDHVDFAFRSPYVIAATPPDDSEWGIYADGCRNGLVVVGTADRPVPVSVSIDDGRTWTVGGRLGDGPVDLTDLVKGRFQYLLRFGAPADRLADAGLSWTTVCQANGAILPDLTDGGCRVTYQATGRAVAAVGPTVAEAESHVVDGGLGTPRVTIRLETPGGRPALAVYAAAHVRSSNPPDPAITYRIDYSTDDGATWRPVVEGWQIPRRGQEPADFWSQSFCWGDATIAGDEGADAVLVRFANDGGKAYPRVESQLVYRDPEVDAARVTFAWTDRDGDHEHAEVAPAGVEPASWEVPTGEETRTRWVEIEPVAGGR